MAKIGAQAQNPWQFLPICPKPHGRNYYTY